MTQQIVCANCNDEINTDDDVFYESEINKKTYCQSCQNEDVGTGSTVLIVGPDYEPDREGPFRVYVGDWFVMDRWGDPCTELQFSRNYHSTDAWRGFYETKIIGWVEVVGGWTTGWGGDSTGDRKVPFNEWAEALFTGEIVPPVNVAIITDPTSNVFSTGIGVFVPVGQEDTFTNWVNGELDNLRYALT
jgi:hypothetical protein